MQQLLAPIKRLIRRGAARVAYVLDTFSHHRITPDMVTWSGFVMHIPIAVLIGLGRLWWAAGLLVIFGLFDTLDGELARLQSTASPRGMLLDASTDRLKEVLLYSGSAYVLASGPRPVLSTLATLACGTALCVSYIKAKGEAAVAASGQQMDHAQLNRMFADGFMSFEIRMCVLIAGLLSGQLGWAVGIIAVFATVTAAQRLISIMGRLR